MDTKLTLSLDKAVINRAKQYAKKNKTSLSSLVENYLGQLTNKEKTKEPEIHPLVKELTGVIKLPKGFDEKETYRKHIIEKYR